MAMLPKNGRSEMVKMRFENEKENEYGRAMLPGRFGFAVGHKARPTISDQAGWPGGSGFMPDGIEHYLSSQS